MRLVIASRIMARTTVNLDPAVLRELKKRAAREGKSLGQVISEIAAISLSSEPGPPHSFRWKSREMKARIDLEDKEELHRKLDGR
jgi:plasmid stability protein